MTNRFAQFDPARPDGVRHGVECVRVATPADADAVARLSADRDGLDFEEIREPVARSLAVEANSDTACVLVAEVDGSVMGYGRARYLTHADGVPEALPEGWYLCGVVVHTDHRRRGLGAALTAARVEHLRDRTNAIHFVTSRKNRVSIAMHEQFGFEQFAEGFDYPKTRLTSEWSLAYRLVPRSNS